MKSQDFQFSSYTAGEFEQFRTAVQQDGFSITQNTIDTVSGHIGSLTYITGKYNRNQQTLTVTVKTSPWGSTQDADLKTNVLRVVNKSTVSDTAVNTTPVTTPITAAGTPVKTTPTPVAPKSIAAGPVKNTVAPPALTTAQASNVDTVLKQAEAAKTQSPAAATPIVPKQTPVPAATSAATAAPTEPAKAN